MKNTLSEFWTTVKYEVHDERASYDSMMSGVQRHIWLDYAAWLGRYIANYAKSLYCERYGHELEDRSSAGPDSGNMDHACRRCNRSWSVPLY